MGGKDMGTYVWFSPLGARIHAAAQKIAVTTSPMKGAQLVVLVSKHFVHRGANSPVSHGVCRYV